MAFLYGVPFPAEDFSGRQAIALTVCERLAQQQSSTCLAGGPKTGRTSLLRYLASPQAAAKFPVLGRSINVYVSADALGQTRKPSHFWADVLRELTGRVPATYRAAVDKNLVRARAGELDLYDLKDLFDAFGRANLPIVLLIDDFDTLLRNQHFWPPDDYFHNVRHLGSHPPHGLAFVVATSRALNELWDPNKGASPFYNIMANITIGELPDAELRQYLRDGFASAGATLEVEVEDLIVEASGGHPHLANYVATLCLQKVRAGQPVEPAELQAAFDDPAGPVVTLIREIREKLSPVERQWLDMLSKTPAKLTDSQRADLAKLRRYGLLPPGSRLG